MRTRFALAVVAVVQLLAALPVRAPAQQAPAPDARTTKMQQFAEGLENSTVAFLGRGKVAACEKKVAELPRDAQPGPVYQARLALAHALLESGQIEEAIAEYQRCLDVANKAQETRAALSTRKRLAIAWMRLGERQNCVSRHGPESCILPLQGDAIHVDRKGSEEAIRILEPIVRNDGADYGAMWLLNLAHMTLGTWPDGVPAPSRIPAGRFDPEYELPRMPDISAKAGIRTNARAGGSAMDDFDGDGRLDIVVSAMDTREPIRMFRQQPDRTFHEVTEEVGLAGQWSGLNFLHFDANNDGRLDLLVPRGAWMHAEGKLPNTLWIQQADGTFADRTVEAGVEVLVPSQVAVTADVDLDGDLDLFLGVESEGSVPGRDDFSRLYRNRGDGTFEDVTDKAGVGNGRYCKGAAFGDYNGDGLPDLYVSNLQGWNRLYRNDGDCRFTDVAPSLGVTAPYDSFSCWFFDHDNDGWLDLFVAGYDTHDRQDIMGAWFKNGAAGFDTMRLYRNEGGKFRDVTVEQKLARACFAMGSNFGDVDNDGFPDMYLATGDPDFTSLWPNLLLRNDQGRGFQDVSTCTGTGHLQKGHGVSFGDFDEDGDQDLFADLGGAFIDDAFANVFFENPGHGNHWITVRLVGTKSNRFGVGARIRARIEEAGQERDVYSFVGANSSFGGNSFQAEIGLGKATRIVELEVTWPASKTNQKFAAVPLDRTLRIVEGASEFELVPASGSKQ